MIEKQNRRPGRFLEKIVVRDVDNKFNPYFTTALYIHTYTLGICQHSRTPASQQLMRLQRKLSANCFDDICPLQRRQPSQQENFKF